MDGVANLLGKDPQLLCCFPIRCGQGAFHLFSQTLQARLPPRALLDVEALDSPTSSPEEVIAHRILLLLFLCVREVIEFDGQFQPTRCTGQGELEGKIDAVGLGKAQLSRCRSHGQEPALRQPTKAETTLRQHAQQFIEPITLGGNAEGAVLVQESINLGIVDKEFGDQAEPQVPL